MQKKNTSKCIILNVRKNDTKISVYGRWLSPHRKDHGFQQAILIKKKKKLKDCILNTKFYLKHKSPKNFYRLLTYLCYN